MERIRTEVTNDEMVFPSGGQSWSAVMLKTFGREFHEALAKNELQYDRNIPAKAQRVASLRSAFRSTSRRSRG
jgi:hypothetical protein